jgi:hypothetical protein
MVNPSPLLVLLQSQKHEHGIQACVFGLSFQFNPTGPFYQQNLTVMFGGLHYSLPYGDGTTYQRPLASEAESHLIPPISSPKELEIDWSCNKKISHRQPS